MRRITALLVLLPLALSAQSGSKLSPQARTDSAYAAKTLSLVDGAVRELSFFGNDEISAMLAGTLGEHLQGELGQGVALSMVVLPAVRGDLEVIDPPVKYTRYHAQLIDVIKRASFALDTFKLVSSLHCDGTSTSCQLGRSTATNAVLAAKAELARARSRFTTALTDAGINFPPSELNKRKYLATKQAGLAQAERARLTRMDTAQKARVLMRLDSLLGKPKSP